jgi:prepilin peptidase CpaA
MLTTLWVHPSPYFQWGSVLLCAVIAAAIDVRSGRIPNGLTGGMWIAGLVASLVAGGLAGAGDAVLGCLVMAAPFVLLFLIGGGAGDAKLMGAIGMWLGVVNGVIALLSVLVVGAVVGICYAVVRQRSGSVVANLWVMATGMLGVVFRAHKLADVPDVIPQANTMTPMPYGLSILVGVAVAAAGIGLFRSGVLG